MSSGKRSLGSTKGHRARPVSVEIRRDKVVALAVLGTPVGVIAKELDLARETVSRIIHEPEVRARIEAARQTAIMDGRADLQASTRWLTGRLLELAASRNQAVAVRAIVEALSKVGFDAPKRIDLGLLAGSTDEELWAKLRDLERRVSDQAKLEELPAETSSDDEEPSDG